MIDGTVNLLQNILQNSSNDYVVFITIEILWNMITSSQKKEVAEILGTFECLSVLKILFEHFIINGNKESDRHLRNEIMVLFNEIAILRPDYILTFVDIDLVDCIRLFMVHIELRINHPDVSHLIMVTTRI